MKKNKKMICLLLAVVLILSTALSAFASGKTKRVTLKKGKTVTAYAGEGQTVQLKAAAGLTWTSSKKTIATVRKSGKNGIVTTKKKGTTTIKATKGKTQYTCKLIVETPKINRTKLSIAVGQSKQLKVSGTKQGVKWSSSNKKVAIVSDTGTVTGKNLGKATITADIGGMTYKCKVTVISDEVIPTAAPTTGWKIIDDAYGLVQYYYQPDECVVNQSYIIDGLTFYFDNDGYRINDLTDRIAFSHYYLECDRVNGVITVYDSTKKIPVKSIRCSVGAPGNDTPKGSYTLTPFARWVNMMGMGHAQYGTLIIGNCMIHSVPLNTPTVHGVPRGDYYRLGTPGLNPSDPGIAVCVADAKWIYENCGGSTLRILDGDYSYQESFKGPLGRRPIVPMSGDYDPTDPLGTDPGVN